LHPQQALPRPTRKYAADVDVLREMLRCIVGEDLRSVRNCAMLVFRMAGAFRTRTDGAAVG
jgi:hypothetical protein